MSGIFIELDQADAETDPAMLEAALDDCYSYHPWSSEQVAAGAVIREALKHAARQIILLVPPSRDRDAALRKLREARMDANSAITHGGRY